ncbi:MAG: hypothetical protein DHS20C16_11540 [Phycisphaerae bacterium]|nr:MAG: hypothetical protein DHS20C16_11540 [Phycisphaerae bacterium]
MDKPVIVGLCFPQRNLRTSRAAELMLAACLLAVSPEVRAADCNSNGVEDAIEVATGTSADCDSNGVLDECEGILFVDDSATNGLNDGSSWANAYVYLQDALAAADVDCAISQVWVAAGTYRPDQGIAQSLGDRGAAFQLQTGLAVYGGFSGNEIQLGERDVDVNETILSGDLLGDDLPDFVNDSENSFHVVVGSGTDSTAKLSGFVITAGNADTWPDNQGGGIYNESGHPTLERCKFEANWAAHPNTFFGCDGTGEGGGGMANNGSSPFVVDCTFDGNHSTACGPGIYNYNQSNPAIENCEFRENRLVFDVAMAPFGGAGIHNDNSNPTVTNCAFVENYGGSVGGMHNEQGSSPTVTDCVFTGNQYGGMDNQSNSNPTLNGCDFLRNLGAGLSNVGSHPTVRNCMFSANTITGMFNISSDPEVANCMFVGNGSSGSGGGGMYNIGSDPYVTNSTFSANTVDTLGVTGGEMLNAGNSSPVISNCVFWGDTLDQIVALNSNPIVNYCVIRGGWGGAGGVGIIDADPLFVDSNGPDDIIGTEDDDLRLQPGSPAIDAGDNSAVPVGVTVDLNGDARFSDDINSVDTGVGPPPIVDIGAYEFQARSVLYVDADATGGAIDGSSWADAYVFLQDALLDASTNSITNQIWVAEGTYEPDEGAMQTAGDPFATFELRSGLALYGGFSGTETELSQRDPELHISKLTDGGPNYGILTAIGVDSAAILDGFTVADASWGMSIESSSLWVNDCRFDNLRVTAMENRYSESTISNCQFSNNGYIPGTFAYYGGAIFNYQSAPYIVDCRFVGNRAPWGAGIAISDSSPIIDNCVFEDNLGEGAGIYVRADSSPIIVNSSFISNRSNRGGGGIASELGSQPTILDCMFRENEGEHFGGGLFCDDCDAHVDRCQFLGNKSRYGGGIHCNSGSMLLVNSVLSGNMADWYDTTDGGGLYFTSCHPELVNCTFSGNSSTGSVGFSGGAIGAASQTFNASNCIFWGNQPNQFGGSFGLFVNSIAQDTSGFGVVSVDPMFVDANGPDDIAGTEDDDLRLLPGSPAIDAGDNSAVPVGVLVDLDGHARFVDDVSTVDTGVGDLPIVDIGAYEFVLGDCDADGDADIDDHVILDGCLTNPDQAFGVGCACLDFDADGDVDLRDFSLFQRGFFE